MVEQEMITAALKEYSITDAAIAKLNTEYMALTVKGVNDKDGYAIVSAARKDIKSRRVEVEKTRKKLKEDALEYGRAVDKEAKRITAMLEPIETYLESQEKIVDDEKARLKAEAEAKEAARIQSRIDKLFSFGCSFNGMNYILPFAPYAVPQAIIKTCPDEQFEQICSEFQKLVTAEQERLEKEKAAKIEEENRLAKVREAQEAEAARLAAIAKEQQEAAAKIQAAQDAIEKEKKRIADAEVARVKAIADAQALENAKKEAAEKARIETEQRIKREAEEKIAAEAKAKKEAEKKAARAPDKEKLLLIANEYEAVNPVMMKTEEGKEILARFRAAMQEAVSVLRKKAELL